MKLSLDKLIVFLHNPFHFKHYRETTKALQRNLLKHKEEVLLFASSLNIANVNSTEVWLRFSFIF